jgi:hypothetical protein
LDLIEIVQLRIVSSMASVLTQGEDDSDLGLAWASAGYWATRQNRPGKRAAQGRKLGLCPN